MIKQLVGLTKTHNGKHVPLLLYLWSILVWSMERDLRRIQRWECILGDSPGNGPARALQNRKNTRARTLENLVAQPRVTARPDLHTRLSNSDKPSWFFSLLIKSEPFQQSWWAFASCKEMLDVLSMFLLEWKILIDNLEKCSVYHLAWNPFASTEFFSRVIDDLPVVNADGPSHTFSSWPLSGTEHSGARPRLSGLSAGPSSARPSCFPQQSGCCVSLHQSLLPLVAPSRFVNLKSCGDLLSSLPHPPWGDTSAKHLCLSPWLPS